VLCKRSPVISFFSWLLDAFRLCHCLRLAHILPNLCLTVCLSECLPNIVRYLVQRLCPLFRPVFHTFFHISTDPCPIFSDDFLASVHFLTWMFIFNDLRFSGNLRKNMWRNFSSPPGSRKAVCLLNCNSFVFLFHLKYLSFRRPPSYNLYAFRAWCQSPKNLQRKLACKNVDGKYLRVGRRGEDIQLPRSSICLTNFVDCLWHSAAVNWIRKVKGKQSGTDWNWDWYGLVWYGIESDRIVSDWMGSERMEVDDNNEILHWLIYRHGTTIDCRLKRAEIWLANSKLFKFLMRNRKRWKKIVLSGF